MNITACHNSSQFRRCMMGKFQLDYKGQQSVQKFHEKLKVEKTDKQSKLEAIKKQYLENKKSGKK